MKEIREINEEIKDCFKKKRELVTSFIHNNADLDADIYLAFLTKEAPSIFIETIAITYGISLSEARQKILELKAKSEKTNE